MKLKKLWSFFWRVLTNDEYRVLRLSELGLYKHMPDDKFLRVKYKSVLHKKLNLDNPQTFNEKMQWLKLNDRNSKYTMMVDKYEVKKYVASIIGEEYIIPTLGVWDRFDEIDFDALPNQFVLKCTHDSGGLAICRDKNNFDKLSAKKKIEQSLKTNFYWVGREWPYKDVKPRIIAEQYLEDENDTLGLTDYKFFCFNNKVKMLYVSQGLEDHATACISFYDLKGNEMPFYRRDFSPITGKMKLPDNFEDMLDKAQKLAMEVDSPFVRIDLYSVCGKTKFSEITFTPCSGFIPFEPEEWDRTVGSWLQLPQEKQNA